ncbi:kelch repeat and BTB domain-containing protein 13-like [Scleropages formosus]|uniref:Kelch repeat and BTB domain-containing protein 13-like n=1 Tax=Scleropages formosus TaxID=113540 RepID=A0A0P7UT60_SCLFO|nr:kelch repeat and BTB domain-containing protein 13-like [Scleropages formosus]
MRECDQEEIHLKGVRARGFVIVLSVMRGEQPILDSDEIVDAIECAAFLQVEPLAKHLVNIINTDNCLLMCHTAATYGLLDLFHSSALFIRDAYCDLKEEARCLPKELVEYTESLTPSMYVTVGTHSPAVEMLQDFMRTVCYLDEDEKDWKVLTDLPTNASTTMAGVAVLDNKLYIVGGVRDISNKVVDTCFCYDATTDTWSTFTGPHQPRYNFSLVGHDDCLYAIGGECERTPMSSVEVYKVSTGVWSHAAQFPRPVAGTPSAKALNRIFICSWKPVGATDIYEYIPAKDEWVLLSKLVRPHSYGHCMVAHRDNLYVMRNGPCDDFLRCMIDCYSLTTGQWTAMPGHYGNSKGALFTAVVRGDSVFTFNRNMTLEYTIENNTWKPKREMKGFPRIGSFWTFLLRVPRTTKQSMRRDILSNNYKKFSNHIDHYQSSFLQCID